MKHLITAHSLHGHWSACFADEPGIGVGGDTPTVALERLLEFSSHQVPENHTLTVADDHCTDDQLAWYLMDEPCPECNGTGWYVGLNLREKCRACSE